MQYVSWSSGPGSTESWRLIDDLGMSQATLSLNTYSALGKLMFDKSSQPQKEEHCYLNGQKANRNIDILYEIDSD